MIDCSAKDAQWVYLWMGTSLKQNVKRMTTHQEFGRKKTTRILDYSLVSCHLSIYLIIWGLSITGKWVMGSDREREVNHLISCGYNTAYQVFASKSAWIKKVWQPRGFAPHLERHWSGLLVWPAQTIFSLTERDNHRALDLHYSQDALQDLTAQDQSKACCWKKGKTIVQMNHEVIQWSCGEGDWGVSGTSVVICIYAYQWQETGVILTHKPIRLWQGTEYLIEFQSTGSLWIG